MGAMKTKEEIIARLDYLDREEINLNKQLRDLQIELNGLVPVKDRVKVKAEYFDNISELNNKNEENESENEENVESENIDNTDKIKDDPNYKKSKNKKKKDDDVEEEEEEDEKKHKNRSKSKKNKKH